MDEAVYVLLADALAVGFRAAVRVDVVPPGASFVMAKSLANEFTHGAALFLGNRLGTLQHVGGKGDGKRSGVPHGNIVLYKLEWPDGQKASLYVDFSEKNTPVWRKLGGETSKEIQELGQIIETKRRLD